MILKLAIVKNIYKEPGIYFLGAVAIPGGCFAGNNAV